MSAFSRRQLQQAPQGNESSSQLLSGDIGKHATPQEEQLFDGSLVEVSSNAALTLRKGLGNGLYGVRGKEGVDDGSMSDSPDREEEAVEPQTE